MQSGIVQQVEMVLYAAQCAEVDTFMVMERQKSSSLAQDKMFGMLIIHMYFVCVSIPDFLLT